MKISIIIPVHNEENIIKDTINGVYDIMKKTKYSYEIIAVDDNSNDKTGQVINNLSNKIKTIKPLHKKNEKNGPTGLGSAIKFGLKNCNGDIIIPFMGDLSDDPKDIIKLINKIMEGYDIVCGSRFIKGSKINGYPLMKMISNRIYNKIFAFLFQLGVNDFSNAFKAYKKEIFKMIIPESDGFEITSEIVLKAHINKNKITEIPVSWHNRTKGGESKLGSFMSPKFLFLKLPRIGFSYGMLSLKLWFKFIKNRVNYFV
jgi:hypothetical protein